MFVSHAAGDPAAHSLTLFLVPAMRVLLHSSACAFWLFQCVVIQNFRSQGDLFRRETSEMANSAEFDLDNENSWRQAGIRPEGTPADWQERRRLPCMMKTC